MRSLAYTATVCKSSTFLNPTKARATTRKTHYFHDSINFDEHFWSSPYPWKSKQDDWQASDDMEWAMRIAPCDPMTLALSSWEWWCSLWLALERCSFRRHVQQPSLEFRDYPCSDRLKVSLALRTRYYRCLSPRTPAQVAGQTTRGDYFYLTSWPIVVLLERIIEIFIFFPKIRRISSVNRRNVTMLICRICWVFYTKNQWLRTKTTFDTRRMIAII